MKNILSFNYTNHIQENQSTIISRYFTPGFIKLYCINLVGDVDLLSCGGGFVHGGILFKKF